MIRKEIVLGDTVTIDGEIIKELILTEGETYSFSSSESIIVTRSADSSPQTIPWSGMQEYGFDRAGLAYNASREETPINEVLAHVVTNPENFSLLKSNGVYDRNRLLVTIDDLPLVIDSDFSLDETVIRLNPSMFTVPFKAVTHSLKVYTDIFEDSHGNGTKTVTISVPTGQTKRAIYLRIGLKTIICRFVSPATNVQKLTGQIQEHIQINYPIFCEFIQTYFNWLSQRGMPSDVIRNYEKYMDIDSTYDAFINAVYRKYLEGFPDARADKRILIKNILDFYQEKGTDRSFSFLMRVLFGEEASVFFPKSRLARSSAAKFYQMTKMNVSSWTTSGNPIIEGATSKARAFVESIETVGAGKQLTISSVRGTFVVGETLRKADTLIALGTVQPIVNKISVTSPGSSMSLAAVFSGGSGTNGQFNVDKLTPAGGVKSIRILNPGYGYTNGNTISSSSCSATLQTGAISKICGFWKDAVGPSSLHHIQDSWYWQIFSYVIESKVQDYLWQGIFKKIIHPSGTVAFAKLRFDPISVSGLGGTASAFFNNSSPLYAFYGTDAVDFKTGIRGLRRLYIKDRRYVIPRVNWTSGTQTTNAVVVTDEWKIYRVVSGGTSVTKPTSESYENFVLDGVTWEYLYTIDSFNQEFITTNYIPILMPYFFGIGSLKYKNFSRNPISILSPSRVIVRAVFPRNKLSLDTYDMVGLVRTPDSILEEYKNVPNISAGTLLKKQVVDTITRSKTQEEEFLFILSF